MAHISVEDYIGEIPIDTNEDRIEIRKRVTEYLDNAYIQATPHLDASASKSATDEVSSFNAAANALLLYLASNQYPFSICEYAFLATKFRKHSDIPFRELFALCVTERCKTDLSRLGKIV